MIRVALLLTISLFDSLAYAGPVVFVAPFRTDTEDSLLAAVSVTERVTVALAEEFEVITIDKVPDFEDYDARVYLESCPPNEYAGCLYVLASRVDAQFSVGGLVKQVGSNAKEIDWIVVDGTTTEVALALRVDVTGDEEEIFYGGVARTLDWVVSGGVDMGDMRGPTLGRLVADDDADRQAKQTAAALEVMGLTMNIEEMVELGRGLDLSHHEITEEELLGSLDQDAALTPWDYLHMTQEEYLAYRNTGSSELAWRRQKLGRAGTFLFSVGGGFTYGSFGLLVDGRYAQDPNAGFSITDARTEAARLGSYSPTIDLDARYGISGNLDVGVELRHALGWKQSAFYIETIGDSLPISTGGGDESYLSRRVGLTANWVQDPNASMQISLGVSAGLLLGGEVIADTAAPDGVLPLTLPTSPYVVLSPTVAMGFSSSSHVSLSVALDLGVELGARSASVREGQPGLMTSNTPTEGGPLILGLSVRMQYRTLTKKTVALFEGALPMGVE
jgi:hypothetical protein